MIVMPACHHVTAHPSRFIFTPPSIRRILFIPVAATTLLAIMGTSFIPTQHEYVIRPAESVIELRNVEVAQAIQQVAALHGLKCIDCADSQSTATFSGNGMTLMYSFSGNQAVRFKIEAYPSGLFFGDSGSDKADALRHSLKKTFAERFQGLEYVEQLTHGQ